MGDANAAALGRVRWLIIFGAVALAAASAVVLVALTKDQTKAPTPQARSRQLDPLPLADHPAWSTGGLVHGVRDGMLLYSEGRTVTLADLATGKRRWSGQYDQPRLLRAGVLVGDEDGLALLSATTGEVRWRASLHNFELRAADDKTALVTIASEVVALDLATGAERWRRTGWWPVAIAGGTVLGAVAPEPPSPGGETLPAGVVAGFDLATGERRWDLASRHDRSELVLTAGDLVLVRVAGADGLRPFGRIFAAATGKPVLTFGDAAASCASDATMIVCQVRLDDGRDGVATFGLHDRQAESSAVEPIGFSIEAVRQGRIFGSKMGEFGTIDRSGRPVDAELPGQLVALTDGYALFRVRGAVHCYPLGGQR